jgi:nucleotide-binding universal stress UspA family protein
MMSFAEARAAVESSGRAVLDDAQEAVRQRAPGVEVREILRYADAADQLVSLSSSAAMVVVGSHGRGSVGSKLLGSVSVRVVRRAHCPVVVVRPGRTGAVRHGVAVGLDGLPESRPVLELAYHQASLHGLPLTVLHAAWSSSVRSVDAVQLPDSPADRDSEMAAFAESLAGMAEKYPDVHVTRRVVEGRAEDLLVDLGERMDLIVLGSHQPHGLERLLLGSVAVAVVEDATCPVAVVPVQAPLAVQRP